MKRSQTIKDHAKETKLFTQRSVIALVMAAILLLVLLCRLYYLQIYQHDRYAVLSDNNRVNVVPIGPNRGLIYDTKGELLAENIPSFSLEITPEQVQNLDETINNLSKIIKITDEDKSFFFRQLKHKRRFEGVPIRMQLSEQELASFAVNRYKLTGVDVVAGLMRHYPSGHDFAHLLGYVGRINERELKRIDPTNYSATQFIGKIGVEGYYESQIHGNVGHQQIETDARGRIVRVLRRTAPKPGSDLHLTIDKKLQMAAIHALENKKGVAVAVNTRTGGLLALVSNPSYDPNQFVVGIDSESYKNMSEDPARPLFNRVLRGQYPPGSTIKPILALEGINKGIISAGHKIYDPGWFQLEGDDHKYRDWKREGHGWINMEQAIAQSCSTYFYDLANRMGINAIHETLVDFGFGQPTKIDISTELNGIVPSVKWKRQKYREGWYTGETLITGIGQGFTLVTPLQLAQAATILANRGEYRQLHVVDYLQDAQGNKVLPDVLKNLQNKHVSITNKKDWQAIIKAMRMTTKSIHGTAFLAFRHSGYDVAAKTGTAQVSSIAQDAEYEEEKLERHLRDHSLFISFAPVNNPEIAIAVILENQKGGSRVARKIYDAYFTERG